MSLSTTINENCPHCNSIQEIEYYQTVNITVDPELKDKVLSGKLNSKICTNCHNEINIFSGLLYHDMENRLIFEIKVTDDIDNGKEKVINDFKESGYIYRQVYSYPELVEKITIFDHKLNDEVIESVSNKLKAILDESIKHFKEMDEISFNLFFKTIEKGLFKKKIVFYCFSNPSQMMEMKFDFKKLSEKEKQNLYNTEILRN